MLTVTLAELEAVTSISVGGQLRKCGGSSGLVLMEPEFTMLATTESPENWKPYRPFCITPRLINVALVNVPSGQYGSCPKYTPLPL